MQVLSFPYQGSTCFDSIDCVPIGVPYLSPIDLFYYFFLTALLDNYEADENLPEKPSAAKRLEEDAFINAITVNGGPIQIAFNYLKKKGKVSSGVSLDIFFLFTLK